jgi:DNA-binding NarL/FixJ family response regulator
MAADDGPSTRAAYEPGAGSARAWVVGREREQTAIAAIVDRVVEGGSGAIVVIEGEPGIGKTTLLNDVAARARSRGVVTAVAAVDPMAASRPFGVMLDALGCRTDASDPVRAEVARLALGAGYEPQRFSLLVEPVGRFAVQEAILDLVEDMSAAAPLVLGVDDVHRADQATLATLEALSRRLGDVPAVVIVTSHPGPRPPKLDHLLDRLRPTPTVLALAPLGEADVAELTSRSIGRPAGPELRATLDRAGGNPALVTAILAASGGAPPFGAADHEADYQARLAASDAFGALLARIEALPSDARAVIDIAAVLGTSFHAAEIAALAHETVSQAIQSLFPALHSGVLVEQGDQLAFRHSILRDQWYQRIPASVRTSLHRDVWKLMARQGSAPIPMVCHVEAAARPGERDAIEVLRAAAAQVIHTDPDTSLGWLDRAAELAGDDPLSPVSLELVVDRVCALQAAGRLLEAASVAGAALELAAGSMVEAELRLGLAVTRVRQGQFEAAGAELERASRLPLISPSHRAMALAELANVRLWAFDGSGSSDVAASALQLAEEAHCTPAIVQSLNVLSMGAGMAGDVERGVELAMRSTSHAPALAGAARPSPSLYLGVALIIGDRLDEANTVLRDGWAACEQRRDAFMVSRHAGALAVAAVLRGRLGVVDETSAVVERIARDIGSHGGLSLAPAVRGIAARARGESAVMVAALAQCEANRGAPAVEPLGLPFGAWLAGLVAGDEGRWPAASATLNGTVDVAAAVGPIVTLWIGADAVRAALRAGDGRRAAATAAVVSSVAERAGTASALGVAATCRALVAADADAIAAAAGALGETERQPEAARAAADAGRAMADAGRLVEAEAWLTAAVRLHEACGASWEAERIHAEITSVHDRAGVASTPKRRVPAFNAWEDLTPGDREIASLVAAGSSNAQIAATLFLSKRTVEWRLSQLYSKLGVSSRVTLARLAQERLDSAAS